MRRVSNMMQSARALFRGCLVLVGLFGLGAAAAQAPQPNVIVILADDLGYGDVGAYGATDILTPNIDRLASEGAAFSNYHVAPSCSISRVMLLTGSYAPRTGMSRNFTPSSTVGIHDDEITLAELAQSAGYETGVFGKWHLGDHYQFRPMRHGFDEFFGIPHSNDMWPFHPLMPVTAGEDPRLTAARDRAELTGYAGQGSTFPPGEGFPNLPLYDGDTIVEFNSDQSTFTSGFTDRAIAFIEQHASARFFVYLPLTAPHVPLHPSVNFVGSSARDLYGDTVEEIDFHVGRVLDKLSELGIDDNTLVIFTSDNGPWLEYGIDGGSGMPFTGGKETQLEGGIRVPALMRWPGQLDAGSVVTEPVSAIDILPTLAGLFGATIPGGYAVDGLDLWPLLNGDVTSLSRPAIFGFNEAPFSQARLGAVRDGDWKLLVNTSGSTVSAVALFDLGADPLESSDVKSSNGSVVSSLTALGQQIVDDINANQRSLGQVTPGGDPFVQNPGFGNIIAMEAEHFHARQARAGHNWDAVTESHNSAGEALRAQPNSGANINDDYVSTSPHLEYRINVSAPGRHYVWVRAKASNGSNDSLHVGLNGAASPNGFRVSNFESNWSWSSTLMGSGERAYVDIGSAGEHAFDVWMREDGIIIDKILLTTSAQFEPQGQGLVESRQGSLGPALQFSTSTMIHSADEGDTTPMQQAVTLSASDGSPAAFSVASSEPLWLSATPTTGTTPENSLQVTADPSGMAAGQYSGTITASASGFVQATIDVTMTITGDAGVVSASVSTTAPGVDLTADGSADWAHWARSSESSVNRKAGVTTQISNITTLGAAGRRFVGGSSRTAYNWTDGTPTGSASTTAGLYFQGTGNGIVLTVPADTTAKRLQVHLGGWQARGQIEVSLSDGDAPFVTTVEDLSTAFDRTLTVDFQAASPGQTLTVRYTLLAGANITLQAATLVGDVAPPPPALQFSTSSLNYSADEGDTTAQQRTVSLSASDGSGAAFSLASSAPAWLSVDPASGTTPAGAVTITADPTGLAAGQYTGTITATASGYTEDEIDVTLNVTGETGVLSASVGATPSSVDLTADGTADWAHWALSTASSVNRKSGVTNLIGAMSPLGAAPRRFGGDSARATYSWTDGAPVGSSTTGAGLYFTGPNNGFQLTVPADTSAKQLQVHLGGWQARGRIEVTLSDGTAPFVTTVQDLSTAFDRTLTVDYQAASPGQTLTVRYIKETGSNITLQAATLAGEVAPPQPSLEFSAAQLTYTADEGDTAAQQQVVSLNTSDSSAAAFSLTSSTPAWLTVNPASGTTPEGTITIIADPTGLGAGQYAGKITATASGYNTDEIDVTLNVVGDTGVLSGAVSTTPGSVNLTADGPADWAHWGRTSASSVNRKAGVTTQISNITTLGAAGRRFDGGRDRALYSWTDGAPTPSANTRAGLYFQGGTAGFEFTVPADTSTKQLQVHLGGWQARGQIEATLSDGTPAYVTTVEDLSTAFDRTVTISFQAAAPGHTLTFRYTKLTGQNVTLQAATLVGDVAPPPPALEFSAATLSFSADEGDTAPLQQTVSLSASDSSAAPFSLGTSAPSWLTVNPTSGTTPAGSITVTANPTGLSAGQYTGTITATASGYVEDQVDVTLTVTGDSGALSAAVGSAAPSIDLTADGSADWIHWGLSSASSVNRKSGVTEQISDFSGPAGRRFAGGNSRAEYSWSDGTPTGATSTKAGLYFSGPGPAVQFTVAADTTPRTLQVHLGGYQARGRIEVSLSDGTVPPFVTTVQDLANPFDRTVTVNYQAALPGQTLTFRYVKETGSNITIQAATLAGGSAGLGLPFADDFDDGDSNGWSVVNETPSAAAWNAGSGKLVQSNPIESTASFEESFHLGSFAWLQAGATLTDYRFSVDVERFGNGRAESLGVVFRYRNPDDYYRFTMNTRYGFSRLEKRAGGVFSTLAVNAVGDNPAAPFTVSVEVEGPDIRVSKDGALVLAATDSAHASGSVGLFTQSPARFDNVVIDPIGTAPDVKLTGPIPLDVVPGGTVDVGAVVRALPAGGAVEFSLTGASPITRNAPPWTGSFTSVPDGLKTVTVRLLDAGSNPVATHSVDIAVGGDYVLAIGDSNPNGIGDTFAADNDDASRVFSNTAFASTLARLLEDLPPTEVVTFNEGIGGDTSNDTDVTRLQSIIDRHDEASIALVQLGTNDANSLRSAAAFESDMQSIVDRLGTAGMDVRVATLPPILDATDGLSSTRNQRIDQYNGRITNDLTGTLAGADIWTFLAPDDDSDGTADRIRTDLYADDLHPNALGHAIIAQLWYNVLLGDATGTTISPFVADFLSQPNYKQNLLEAGDEYFVDSSASLTGVPATLENAVWIMTAHGDAGNSSSSFLTFDLDRSATLYVAYDADATALPTWLDPATSAFAATGLQLTTSQTTYQVYSRPVGAGSVALGGNNAAGAAGASD
ncbi:MAG: sulfatase-like hydrolase/transferase, partial [Woeseiaceae bacterium]|nr:sulfatase-like hydrolase/transferase [Woeseiaceae bacterium]